MCGNCDGASRFARTARSSIFRCVKTIADPAVRVALAQRLSLLTREAQRRWGTLSPHEMLCHLGDAAEMVLMTRPRERPMAPRRRPLLKLIGLWTPMRWPHGWKTNPRHDPKVDGTKPTRFEKDRERVIVTMHAMGAARPGSVEPMHGTFGTMSVIDWQRWAYKHIDHHLRQFGL
jgi:hypothetical protein